MELLRKIYIFYETYCIPKRWDILTKYIKKYNIKTFIEIGVWTGENLDNLKKLNPNLNIIGIDPYSDTNYKISNKQETFNYTSKEEFDKIYKSVSKRHLIIRKNSIEVAKGFKDNSLDIVFIDGLHTYEAVKQDLITWLPKIKVGGILTGHDYTIRYYGVIKAVNEILGDNNIRIHEDTVYTYIKNGRTK